MEDFTFYLVVLFILLWISGLMCGRYISCYREDGPLRSATNGGEDVSNNNQNHHQLTVLERIQASADEELSRSFDRRRRFVDSRLPGEEYPKVPFPGQCAVCLSVFNSGDFISKGTSKLCQHEFHRECIIDWLVRATHCPVCRALFLNEDLKETNHENSSERQRTSSLVIETSQAH